MSHFLLCYDIRDKRRLARVHRVAVRHALPLQYSVFYLAGTARQLADLLTALTPEIDTARDDVRVYEVQPLNKASMLGRSFLPDGVWLTGLPLPAWQE